ncbi:MAG: methylated-DNA--[protein]-cysteine S-methyltransferase [Kiritimatiellaeota bacterium]|nr:methylated-DNA--[protein]-cysteine S-methyltransferase [Kiritimatiellota bacterium]
MTPRRPPAERAFLDLTSSWGVIRVTAGGGKIRACGLPNLACEPRRVFRVMRSRCVAAAAADRRVLRQADLYLRALLTGRDLPAPELDIPTASPLVIRVWRALQALPRGATISYGELARRMGCPRKARVVGQACRANVLPLFIPCHRVRAADGSPGGFSAGLPWKRLLLEREQPGHG